MEKQENTKEKQENNELFQGDFKTTQLKEQPKNNGGIKTTIVGALMIAFIAVPFIYTANLRLLGVSDAATQFNTMFSSWLETFKYLIVTAVSAYFAVKELSKQKEQKNDSTTNNK